MYGALRVRDGQVISFTAASRDMSGHQHLLELIAAANSEGGIYVIGDNLASHKSPPIHAWPAEHPREQQVFIPNGASWLNMQELWWCVLRREAYAGQTFADAAEIDHATAVATKRLNARAKPWVWGRPQLIPRKRCRRFLYRL